MIRPLRRRHLLMVGALALALPALYLAALAARPPEPLSESLAPAAEQAATPQAAAPMDAAAGGTVTAPPTTPVAGEPGAASARQESDSTAGRPEGPR